MRYLFGDSLLSYNQFISSDQELDMYQPIRAIIAAAACLNKSRYCLDTYYLLKNNC